MKAETPATAGKLQPKGATSLHDEGRAAIVRKLVPVIYEDQQFLFVNKPAGLASGADFKPVSAGRATVEFTPESGGQPTALVGPQPSRPGAFRVEEAPPAAGRYRWALVLESPAYQLQ